MWIKRQANCYIHLLFPCSNNTELKLIACEQAHFCQLGKIFGGEAAIKRALFLGPVSPTSHKWACWQAKCLTETKRKRAHLSVRHHGFEFSDRRNFSRVFSHLIHLKKKRAIALLKLTKYSDMLLFLLWQQDKWWLNNPIEKWTKVLKSIPESHQMQCFW